jgi:hypothetical protein
MSVSNIHGIKLDLSWFNIVTSIVSSFGILIGSCWTVKPVQEEKIGLVGFLILIPLFLFRMTSWMIIIAILHSFSLAVFAGIVLLNIVIFILAQKPIRVEPLTHSFLSLILPVPFLPSSKIENKDGLKLLFCLILIGNLTLIGVLALLFFLYNSDKYNPWCSNVNNKLQIPETIMDHSEYFILALFASATIPLVVCILLKNLR